MYTKGLPVSKCIHVMEHMHAALEPSVKQQVAKMIQLLVQMTQMEEVGRRNLWLNAQQEQAMDMQYSQMQGPAQSGESLHPGDGRVSAKSPMALFAQTPSPPGPTLSRPFPQAGHAVSPSYNTPQYPASPLVYSQP